MAKEDSKNRLKRWDKALKALFLYTAHNNVYLDLFGLHHLDVGSKLCSLTKHPTMRKTSTNLRFGCQIDSLYMGS